MSDELRAAAERINEYLNGGGPSLAYPFHANKREAFEAEVSMVIRDYLAERERREKEDAEPVTEEWVRGRERTAASKV